MGTKKNVGTIFVLSIAILLVVAGVFGWISLFIQLGMRGRDVGAGLWPFGLSEAWHFWGGFAAMGLGGTFVDVFAD